MKLRFLSFTIVVVALVISSSLFGHEFWLKPSVFRADVMSPVTLDFLVGDKFEGERWENRSTRTQSLMLHNGKSHLDITAKATIDDISDISLVFPKAGTYMVTMESSLSQVSLPADRFNDYLKEEAIDEMYAVREQKGQLDLEAREGYMRCAKTLIQVGDKMDKTFQQNVGMPLEIVALTNPYTLKLGQPMKVKILYQNKPLANKHVLIRSKDGDAPAVVHKIRSDENGLVLFPLDEPGTWMVSVVQMAEIANNPEMNYQSWWASLTFGF